MMPLTHAILERIIEVVCDDALYKSTFTLLRVAGEGRHVVLLQCPRQTACLQRSPMDRLELSLT